MMSALFRSEFYTRIKRYWGENIKISALGVKQQALDIYIMTETNIKVIYNKNRMYINYCMHHLNVNVRHLNIKMMSSQNIVLLTSSC